MTRKLVPALACACASAVAACHGGHPTTPGGGSGTATDASTPILELGEKGVLPTGGGSPLVTATNKATLTSLRKLLPGYDIAPVAMLATTVFHISRGGAVLYEVVPGTDGTIVTIDAVSRDVPDPAHHWRVGDKLADTGAIASCQCWSSPDQKEHALCYRPNMHVGVALDHACDGLDDIATADPPLKGSAIIAIVWNPTVWEEAAAP